MKICRVVVSPYPIQNGRSYEVDQSLSDLPYPAVSAFTGPTPMGLHPIRIAGVSALSFYNSLAGIRELGKFFVLRPNGFTLSMPLPELWDSVQPRVFLALASAYGFDAVEVVPSL